MILSYICHKVEDLRFGVQDVFAIVRYVGCIHPDEAQDEADGEGEDSHSQAPPTGVPLLVVVDVFQNHQDTS